MLGSAVVTTRLSSVTMKMATEAMARVTIERRDMRAASGGEVSDY